MSKVPPPAKATEVTTTDAHESDPELTESLLNQGREVWLAGLGALATAEEQGQRLIASLSAGGKLVEQEAARLYKEIAQRAQNAPEEGASFFKALVERGEELEARGKQQIAEVADDIDEKQDELKERATDAGTRLEARVRQSVEETFERIDVPTRTEIRDLSTQVDRLTAKVDALADALAKKRVAESQ
jgi:poly(hydroxyalkanoate) granule-associated protein